MNDFSEREKYTLIINRNSSKCGNCGKSCSPYDDFHKTVYGYGPQNGEPGCGVIWCYVRSDYIGGGTKEWTIRMRPDLEWVG